MCDEFIKPNLIHNAVLYGDNVEEGLEDILEDLRKLASLQEKNKQVNLEGDIMLKVLIPFLFLGSIYFMFQWFHFTVEKYIAYQFKHPLGFQMLIYSLVSLCVTFLIYQYMKREKNDF